MNNPWMKTITTGNANTAQNLLTLMQVADANAPDHCRQLTIQVDPVYGGTYVYIGNSDVSASVWGRKIVPTQAPDIGPAVLNGIATSQIWIFADHASAIIGITAFVD